MYFAAVPSASAIPPPEPAAQGGQRGRFGRRPPEARKFAVVAQLLVGERQLRVELRAALGAGKLMQMAQPRPGPLERIAKVAGPGGAGAEAALDPGVLGQRRDLKLLVARRRQPTRSAPRSNGGSRRRPGLRSRR